MNDAENRPKAPSERKVEKVVTGEVKTKKKSEARKFADVFISEDIHSVKSYVVQDVVVPAITNLIEDIVVNGIRMILRGDTGSGKKRDRDYVSYRDYARRDERRDRGGRREGSSRFDYEDLVFTGRGDAEAVLDELQDTIETYGLVSVAEFYDAAGRTAPYTAHQYGWTNLRNAEIVRVRGGYIIRLPRAVAID